MRPLQIADSAAIILGLQDEIRRSEESRYDHRLHGVLLVAQGMTCPEVAQLLGDAPRSIEYWVGRFEKEGLAGLWEGGRSGRPRRLSEKQMEAVDRILRRSAREAGLSGNLWDGKTLSRWLEQSYHLIVGVRNANESFVSSATAYENPDRRWPTPTLRSKKRIKKLQALMGDDYAQLLKTLCLDSQACHSPPGAAHLMADVKRNE